MSELTLINIMQASKAAGVSRQTIYNWIKAGKLHPVRIMGLPYVERAAVLEVNNKKSQ